MVGIIDPPRSEARDAVAAARRAGVRVMMITGDHPLTAARIAGDLGIVAPGAPAMTGMELEALDDDGLRQAVRDVSVFARVAPEHKLRIVDALQADGNVVAMTGDGVNDAPALKSADIGVAMGITGTEVTRQAATMILADDNFATIVEAVREGRGIFDNIKKFLRYLLSSNTGEVLTVLVGVLAAGALGLSGHGEAVVVPLLATQILWINLLTDSAPALAMGVDPQTDDMMARPPRRLTDRVIDVHMWVGVLLLGAVMAVVTLLTIDLYLPGGMLPGSDSLDTARTAGFTVLVLAQLFNAFNARSETTSAFHRMFANRWLWGAVVLSLGLHGRRRPPAGPQYGLRHGAAAARAVAGLRGDGQHGAVGRRAAQGRAACLGTPPGGLRRRRHGPDRSLVPVRSDVDRSVYVESTGGCPATPARPSTRPWGSGAGGGSRSRAGLAPVAGHPPVVAAHAGPQGRGRPRQPPDLSAAATCPAVAHGVTATWRQR